MAISPQEKGSTSATGFDRVANYDDKFVLVNPRAYPTVTLARIKQGDKLTEEVIRWGERNILPLTFTLTDALPNNGTAIPSLAISSSVGLRVGTLCKVESSEEIFRVTSNTDGTHIAITRGVAGETGGGYAAANIGDTVQILGTPVDEGMTYANAPTPLMYTAEDVYNYPMAFYEPIAWTKRMSDLVANGGLRYKQNHKMFKQGAMEIVKRSMNTQFLDGKRATVAGTDGPNTKTGGIPQFAYWVNTSFGNITDRETFEAGLEGVSKHGPDVQYCACSGITFRGLQRLYQGDNPSISTGQVPRKAGVQIRTIYTVHGTALRFYWDECLPDYVNNGTTYGQFRIWCPSLVKWRPISPFGRYKKANDGGLNSWDYIYTDGGWVVKNAKACMVGKGVTLA